MALLGLTGGWQIVRQAQAELRAPKLATAAR
jgi:hypothetical protein